MLLISALLLRYARAVYAGVHRTLGQAIDHFSAVNRAALAVGVGQAITLIRAYVIALVALGDLACSRIKALGAIGGGMLAAVLNFVSVIDDAAAGIGCVRYAGIAGIVDVITAFALMNTARPTLKAFNGSGMRDACAICFLRAIRCGTNQRGVGKTDAGIVIGIKPRNASINDALPFINAAMRRCRIGELCAMHAMTAASDIAADASVYVADIGVLA